MEALKWLLFFVWICCNVVKTETSSWRADLPPRIKGLLGSCVVIPCSFKYQDTSEVITTFTGIWMDQTNHVIYHPVESKIMESYRGRTELLGDVTQKNCTLKIDRLQQSDRGPFYFRIEMKGYDNFSYKGQQVSIDVTDKINTKISVQGEVVEHNTTVASCYVSPICPVSPPVFNWSHSGVEQVHSQRFNEQQWEMTATLAFRPTNADHNRPLLCSMKYKGGQQQEASMVLKVKHAPVNVKVEYITDVREGKAVELICSSDAHPPASSYEWHSETGAQLQQGKRYRLPNVSRHISPLYCSAINKFGRGKSSPVQLNVLYPPEIKPISSCSPDGNVLRCLCIVDSNPPSMVHFVLRDRVLPGTKTEKHGLITVGTLQVEFGSSEVVRCLANNTMGNSTVFLSLPVKDKMQNLYIAVAVGAGVVLMILVAVGFVKKCRGASGDTPAPHMNAMQSNKAEELAQCATTKRKETNYNDVHYRGNDHVYGNMETDCDDAIYANV